MNTLQNSNNVSTPQANAASNIAKWNIIEFLLGVLGFLASAYALYEHIQILAGKSLTCNINEVINCEDVIGSQYGEFLSIPLGAWGMVFWSGVLALAWLPRREKVSEIWCARWRMVAAGLGILASAGLAYLAYGVLKRVCVVCTATYIACILYAIYASITFVRAQKLTYIPSRHAMIPLISLGMLLGVPSLLVGFILPQFDWASMKNEQSIATNLTEEALKPLPMPPVNKSIYAGNGEDYRIGNDSARLIMQVYTDPFCPFCSLFHATAKEVLKRFGNDRLLIVFRLYPLENCQNPSPNDLHPGACNAALAIRCAGLQGKFMEFLEYFYNNQRDTSKHDLNSLKALATELKMDVKSFEQCYQQKLEMPKILDDIRYADEKLNIRGTPTVFVNGIQAKNEISSAKTLILFLETLESKNLSPQ